PQSSSHIIIKQTTPVVPVLLGPQIPRREREETRERYCRALLFNRCCMMWMSYHECVEIVYGMIAILVQYVSVI
ncbi:unnamed protein product, partial [Rotaria sp. Silwood2]